MLQKEKNHKIVFYGMICLRQPIKGENYYGSKTVYHKKTKRETLNFIGKGENRSLFEYGTFQN